MCVKLGLFWLSFIQLAGIVQPNDGRCNLDKIPGSKFGEYEYTRALNQVRIIFNYQVMCVVSIKDQKDQILLTKACYDICICMCNILLSASCLIVANLNNLLTCIIMLPLIN